MNTILLTKVKKDLGNRDLTKAIKIVKKLQKKFNINKDSDIFDIENKINDEEYSKVLKEFQNK